MGTSGKYPRFASRTSSISNSLEPSSPWDSSASSFTGSLALALLEVSLPDTEIAPDMGENRGQWRIVADTKTVWTQFEPIWIPKMVCSTIHFVVVLAQSYIVKDSKVSKLQKMECGACKIDGQEGKAQCYKLYTITRSSSSRASTATSSRSAFFGSWRRWSNKRIVTMNSLL